MVLKGILTFEGEVKCHGDLFHEILRHKPHDLSNICPNHIKGCELHEGEKFGDSGSIYIWYYTLAGSSEQRTYKALIDIDEQQKTTTFKGIEGDLFEIYKEYKITLRDFYKDDDDGDKHHVKWTIEYEKIKEVAPEPTFYLELLINVIKDIEAHHVASSK